MRRSIAVAGLAAGVLAGAVGASVLSPVDLAGAAQSVAVGDTNTDGQPGRERSAEWIADALGPLVGAGTINQTQADAVTEALVESMPHRGHGPRHLALDEVADLLGISLDELHQALRDGQTLAELGAEHDVEVQSIIGVLIAAIADGLGEAVDNGRITQERADEILANATERITAFVNEGPARGEHGERGQRLRDRLHERLADADAA